MPTPLSESSLYTSVVVASGVVTVVRDDMIFRGATAIAKETSHQHILNVGDDVSQEDPRVALIASAAWVPQALIPQAMALLAPLIPKVP